MAALRLDDFLKSAGREPWQWGESDAFMFAGRWIESATGIDITSGWRGRYGSCEEACRIVADTLGGGPINAARAVLALHGIERTRCPMRGDVALVIDRTAEGLAVPTAAICINRRMRCIKLRHGVAVRAARTLIAWKVPHHG